MFIAATHNGISRLYETFGNGGARHGGAHAAARRVRAHLVQAESAAAARRSGRSATTTTTSRPGCSISLNYFADNSKLFLRNFYEKASARSRSRRPKGRRRTCFPADDPRPGAQAELLRMLQKQGVRDLARDRAVHRDDAGEEARAPRPRWRPARGATATEVAAEAATDAGAKPAGEAEARARGRSRPAATSCAWTSRTAASPTRCSTISTGRRTIRRRASYDDTGWTFPRARQRAGGARHRREGARRADGARRRATVQRARRRRRAPAIDLPRSTTTPTTR